MIICIHTGGISRTVIDIPRIVGDIPRAAGNIPRIVGDIPRAAGDVSRSMRDIPRHAGDTPHNAGDIPQMAADIPRHAGNTCHAAVDTSRMTGDTRRMEVNISGDMVVSRAVNYVFHFVKCDAFPVQDMMHCVYICMQCSEDGSVFTEVTYSCMQNGKIFVSYIDHIKIICILFIKCMIPVCRFDKNCYICHLNRIKF